ncbi:MAG: DUF4402 domain-containing protein [Thermoanaerobaculia bacterium]
MNEKSISSRIGRTASAIALLLVASALLSTYAAEATTASASIGVRILAPADVDIASGAVTVSGVSSLEWTGAPEVRNGQAVAINVSPRQANSGAAQWLVRAGRNAARTMQVPSEAVVRNGDAELTVSGLSLQAGDARPELGGAVAVALGGNLEIGAGATAGSYVGNVLVVTAWE